jgi:curved DNA-binding protein CbpA
MANELYHVLDVQPEAAPEDIRKAYYRLVRRHPPETDPERFKAIRSAYETLSDPGARGQYDALQQHGGEIEELFQQASEHMGRSEWLQAIRKLKRVIALAPQLNSGWNQLGVCFLEARQFDKAIEVFATLTERQPETVLYWSHFGHAWLEKADALEGEDRRRPSLFRKARESFRRTVELDRTNPDHYIQMARTYSSESRWNEAIQWCERGAAAGGPDKRADFECLFYLCEIHLLSARLDQIEKVAQRIQDSLAEEEEEPRRFAAVRFVQFALELQEASWFRPAATFYQAARRFAPEDEKIRDLYENASSVVRAAEAHDELQNDSLIAPGLKRLVAWYLADLHEEQSEDRDRSLLDILDSIQAHPPGMVAASIKRIRQRYPDCHALNKKAFDRLEEVANDKLQATIRPSRATGHRRSNCFVVTATFGTPAAAEVQRFRSFRDRYLLRYRLGRWFIRAYYRVGPSLARWIERRPAVRRWLARVLGWVAQRLPSPE